MSAIERAPLPASVKTVPFGSSVNHRQGQSDKVRRTLLLRAISYLSEYIFFEILSSKFEKFYIEESLT